MTWILWGDSLNLDVGHFRLPCAAVAAVEQRDPQDIEMIRLGNTIRLTRREVERFTKITGMPPVGVKTLDDLDEYIGKCKTHFWGVSEDTRFLHFLLDEERSRCLGAA